MARRRLDSSGVDDFLDSPPPVLSEELLRLMPIIFESDDDDLLCVEASHNDSQISTQVLNNISNESVILTDLSTLESLNANTFLASDSDVIPDTPIKPAASKQPSIQIAETPPSSNDVAVTEDADKKKTRKRKRAPKTWVCNVRKINRQAGKAYTDINNKAHTPRKMQGRCLNSGTCSFKCENKIDVEHRVTVFERFWTLSEEKKQSFYGKFISCTSAKRKRTLSVQSRRSKSFSYFFEIDSVQIPVCRHCFLTTLDISRKRIYYWFKNNYQSATGVAITPSKGKYSKRITSDNLLDGVRSHIKSFPTVESHYCRQSTQKKDLDSTLNITIMYDLYLKSEYATESFVKPHKYREIFNTEFNLSFFVPKKDRCDTCEKIKLNPERCEDEILAYEKHATSKLNSKTERDEDRVIQKENGDTAVISFDLQIVFSLPKANVSNFFYRRKLSAYNLTAYCSANDITYCALWHEAVAGRAANHVASAMYKILLSVTTANPHLKRIILWSDSFVPQNRNRIMSVALMDFLNNSTNLTGIVQKFSEPGHGLVQEVDAIHSKIEKFCRNLEIYSPLSLIRTLTKIPSRKAKLQIFQMTPNDYFNYSSTSDLFLFAQVPYTKVKSLVYQKNSMVVYHKLKFEGQLDNPDVSKAERKTRKRKDNTRHTVLPRISQIKKTSSLKNDKEKIKDIEAMLDFMPQCDNIFYQTIFEKY